MIPTGTQTELQGDREWGDIELRSQTGMRGEKAKKNKLKGGRLRTVTCLTVKSLRVFQFVLPLGRAIPWAATQQKRLPTQLQ